MSATGAALLRPRDRRTVGLPFALFALLSPESQNQRKKLRGEQGETNDDEFRKRKIEDHDE